MRNILDMSFADLSLPVKSCFLYVSVFPENYTIKKDRLIRVWVAEGFIPKRDEKTSWETGENYFNELVSRRLIQPVFDYDDGQAVGCTVHGVILDFIASLSSEENFVTAGAELRSGPFPCETIRRFSLDCSNQEEDDILTSSTVHISKVRSLTCFGDVKRMPDETLHCLRFLRVLDLEDTENLGNRHLEGIGRLVLLRYLGLGGTDIEELPEEIGRLQRLETLDLRRTTQLRTLPASIVRLRRLVSLLGERVQLPSGIGNMQDLEELSTIDGARSLDSVAELLAKSKRLRMLGVHWGVYYHYAPDCQTTETYRRSVMSFLKEVGKSNLQSLLLDGYRECALLDILLDSWVPPRHLRRFELTISITFRGRVPPKMASLVNLTQLRISITRVEAEGLRVLGTLPNLNLLKLESQFDAKRRIITSRHGFRCLVVFSYTCRYPGMGLQFTPGAMPQLRRLRIEFSTRKTEYLYGNFDFGIQHLSCLTRVHAAIRCRDEEESEVDAAEAAITEQVSKNPNSPVLELSREIIAPQEEHETVQESYEQESRISDKDFDEEPATLQKQHEIMEVDVDSNTNKQADSRVSTLSESSSHLVNPELKKVESKPAIVMEVAMVSASKGAMDTLLTKLTALTANLIGTRRKEVMTLKDELGPMNALLEKLADMTELNFQMKNWRNQMREMTYDIEDCIDDLMLQFDEDNAKPYYIHQAAAYPEKWDVLQKFIIQIQSLMGKGDLGSMVHKTEVQILGSSYMATESRLPAVYDKAVGLVGTDGPRDEMVEKRMDSAEKGDLTIEGMKKIFHICYSDLPRHMKSCLLYLSVFPGNHVIRKDRVIWRWIAEGFIPRRGGESLLETGESYFQELICRKLIEPTYDGEEDDDVPTSCRVHGVILEFITLLSNEENFVTTDEKTTYMQHGAIRRLTVSYSNQEEDDAFWPITEDLSKVRSLTFFGDVKQMPDETLHCLRFLRVLDLEDTENLGNRHLKGIGRLVLLRYLGLGGIGVYTLPEEIGELQHLETLDLRRTTRLRTLPASIVGLRKLVRLLLSGRVQLPREIWKVEKLEELSTIVFDSSSSLDSVAELLITSKQLRMLGIHWGWRLRMLGDRGHETTETNFRSFLKEVGKSNLQSLLLEVGATRSLLDILLDSWVPPHHLRRFELTIFGLFRGGIPPKMASLVNLTHLRISITRVEAEGLRVLGYLSNLILLKLEYVFHDERILVTSRDGFRCLVVFSYTCRYAGMGLQFTPGAMPQLRRLRIEFSATATKYRYGDFDFGIQHLSCLTRIHAAIRCLDAREEPEVEAAEAAITEQVSKNPNSPVLKLLSRYGRKAAKAAITEQVSRYGRKAAEAAITKQVSKSPYSPVLELSREMIKRR